MRQNYARAGRRFLSSFIDLFIVLITVAILYFFPFQMIIGKIVDKDYKNNVRKPYDEITEKYNGSTNLFGNTTQGLYAEFEAKFDSTTKTLTLDKSSYDTYTSYRDSALHQSLKFINDSADRITDDTKDQTAARPVSDDLYVFGSYAYYAYQILLKYPHNAEGTLYSSLKNNGSISEDEYNTLVKEYNEDVTNKYKELIVALNDLYVSYSNARPDSKILSSMSYSTLKDNHKNLKIDFTKSNEFTNDSKNSINLFINYYNDWARPLTTTDQSLEDDRTVAFTEEAHDILYYSLGFNEVNEKVIYIERYSKHANMSVAYLLIAFSVIFVGYTAGMNGYTLGRRICKIRLVKKADVSAIEEKYEAGEIDEEEKKELIKKARKTNPLIAAAHDSALKYFYFIVIGLYSLMAAAIVLTVISIIDIVMASIKSHRTIRDYATLTEVIEVSSF